MIYQTVEVEILRINGVYEFYFELFYVNSLNYYEISNYSRKNIEIRKDRN